MKTSLAYLFNVNEANKTAIMNTLDKLPQRVKQSTMTIAEIAKITELSIEQIEGINVEKDGDR